MSVNELYNSDNLNNLNANIYANSITTTTSLNNQLAVYYVTPTMILDNVPTFINYTEDHLAGINAPNPTLLFTLTVEGIYSIGINITGTFNSSALINDTIVIQLQLTSGGPPIIVTQKILINPTASSNTVYDTISLINHFHVGDVISVLAYAITSGTSTLPQGLNRNNIVISMLQAI